MLFLVFLSKDARKQEIMSTDLPHPPNQSDNIDPPSNEESDEFHFPVPLSTFPKENKEIQNTESDNHIRKSDDPSAEAVSDPKYHTSQGIVFSQPSPFTWSSSGNTNFHRRERFSTAEPPEFPASAGTKDDTGKPDAKPPRSSVAHTHSKKHDAPNAKVRIPSMPPENPPGKFHSD